MRKALNRKAQMTNFPKSLQTEKCLHSLLQFSIANVFVLVAYSHSCHPHIAIEQTNSTKIGYVRHVYTFYVMKINFPCFYSFFFAQPCQPYNIILDTHTEFFIVYCGKLLFPFYYDVQI